jgi:hypothetical protein
LLQSEIFFARPRASNSEGLNHVATVDGIFRDWEELDGASAFAQRILFVSEGGIDQAQDAKRRRIIRLLVNQLFLSRARFRKRGVSRKRTRARLNRDSFVGC